MGGSGLPKVVRVLSIDGGGIRGLIPALVLAEIENRTGKRVAELFDLIAGTSTGGILALGLTRPGKMSEPAFSAAQMAALYENKGHLIFSRSIWHRLRALGSILTSKYPANGLENVMEQYFGQTLLSEALTELLVTSYEIERRRPWFFKTIHARSPKKDGYDFPMKKVARATSAAPIYFPPVRFSMGRGKGYCSLIDGGVFANNPAMCAYAEVKKMFEPGTDIQMVSLGTGELTRPVMYHRAKRWGLIQWAQPLLNIVFDGISDTVDYQLQQLLPEREDGLIRYCRLQTTLVKGDDDMDKTSLENIVVLKMLADEIVERNTALLDVVCRQLMMRFE